jgi:hypothetical protein
MKFIFALIDPELDSGIQPTKIHVDPRLPSPDQNTVPPGKHFNNENKFWRAFQTVTFSLKKNFGYLFRLTRREEHKFGFIAQNLKSYQNL